jgi:hypothetical protein
VFPELAFPESSVAEDLDADGDLDVLFACWSGVVAFENDGTAVFSEMWPNVDLPDAYAIDWAVE